MKYFDLNKIDVNSEAFKKWKKKADDLEKKLNKCTSHEKRREFINKHNHWTDFKEILISNFGSLCWYTDCDLTGSFGDIDHFKPKLKSKDLDNRCLREEGYWKLTYNYKNFRLSSEKANRPNNMKGKGDYFPVRCIEKSNNQKELSDLEEPLLLDPCNLNDTRLIGYREGGIIWPESDDPWVKKRINTSIELYNMEESSDRRGRITSECDRLFATLLILVKDDNSPEHTFNSIKEMVDRKAPYSSIAFKYMMFLSDQPQYEPIKEEVQILLKNIYGD